jgi:hypothetical protein
MLDAPQKPVGWARVFAAMARSHSKILRQGVWYPVLRDDRPDRVSLEIAGRVVDVPRKVVEIRSRRPTHFSVISRFDSTADSLGKRYAVCPNCAARATLFGQPASRKCPTCGHSGEVGWWE